MSVVDNCLEALKNLALKKTGISVMKAHYARHISCAVFKETNYEISEIAILRTFNFLPAKFPPSYYTKDVLALYCGYENYFEFCRNSKL
jgi:hypothetical protein